ncbi:MAG: GDP-mannose 4,6-dehydratase [Alphaproteobacteria bacterium]
MKYLVLGGAGFIGSHFVDRLLKEQEAKVTVVDNFFLGNMKNLEDALSYNKKIKIYKEDAANTLSLNNIIHLEKPDIIINFATKALLYSFENPAEAFNVNNQIIINLLEALRLKKYQRLLHISTSEVFGSAVCEKINEDHPLLPETTYAAGKASADLAIRSYLNMFDLDVLVLRPFNNYGPRQNREALAAIIPVTIMRILDKKEPIIEGDGLQTRDFIYVKDTVHIIKKFIDHPHILKEKFYNIGSGIETNILSLVTEISNLMGFKGNFLYKPKRSADVQRHLADTSRLKAAIKDIPLTPFSYGLSQTIEWYKKH